MRRKPISPAQEAGLTRLYFSEYRKRVRAGDHEPFAAMMANRAVLVERNRISPVIECTSLAGKVGRY
jgi:hypothetical protein